jgi:hypothetical protein
LLYRLCCSAQIYIYYFNELFSCVICNIVRMRALVLWWRWWWWGRGWRLVGWIPTYAKSRYVKVCEMELWNVRGCLLMPCWIGFIHLAGTYSDRNVCLPPLSSITLDTVVFTPDTGRHLYVCVFLWPTTVRNFKASLVISGAPTARCCDFDKFTSFFFIS